MARIDGNSAQVVEIGDNEVLLETERLWLRSMHASDFDELLTIFTDLRVMAAFASPPFTEQQMQWWLQRNLDHQSAHGFGLFSVILKETASLIGDCGLEVMQIDGAPVAEVGYDFRSDFWNYGYATEATIVVRDYAFETLQLPHLISLIRVGNIASRRVAEKVGMSYASDYQNGDRSYWKFEIVQTRP